MNGFVIEVRLSADERLLRALEALGRRSSAQGLVDPRPAALPQAAEAGTAPEAAGRPAADRETIRREAIEEARKKGGHFGTAALFAELKGKKVSAPALKMFAVRNGIPTLRTFSPEKLAQLRAAAERMREKRWGRAGRASGTRAPGVEAERPSAPAPVEADYETALRWGASHGLGGERLDLDQVNAKRESLGLAPFSLQARR